MADPQHQIHGDRLRHFGIDSGHADTDGLPILLDDLGLSDLDLMTIRDLSQHGPESVDDGLIGVLGLMFAALGEGSLCLVLDTDHLKRSVPQTADPAVRKLVTGFLGRLDEGRYDMLIDRTGSGDFKPMVLDDTTGRRLLYFQKFHYHERRLKQRLRSFLALHGDHQPSDETIQTVIDELYCEGAVIRKTLLPFCYYAAMTGALGYMFVNFANNALNAGTIVVLAITSGMIYTIFKFNRDPVAAR